MRKEKIKKSMIFLTAIIFLGTILTPAVYSDDISGSECHYLLTLTTSGSGSGTIQARPAGPYYDAGTHVTIWANASMGSLFGGFSGDLTGTTTPQTLVMNRNKAVNAAFNLHGPYTLTLTTSGTGSGTIQASPAGPYYYGAVVTVWANASVGSSFSGFSGDLTGMVTPQTLTMTGNKAVNAAFSLNGPYVLTLTTSGSGSGTIQASPAGPYYYGAVVTVWANASVGSSFSGFSGDLTGMVTPQTLTMTGNKAVNAAFSLNGPYVLTLTTSGSGSGTIQASPAGPYYYGAVVTVWANASVGSSFSGFSGDLTGMVTPQTLTMTGNKAVNAAFSLNFGYTLTLTASGTGSGTIQASPAGPYYYGAVVTIWANASVGSSFSGFSGDLTGTTSPQTLTINGNKAVNAAFSLNGPYVLTLTTSGSGSGTIQASPAGPYYYGAVVTIWANASVGSSFSGFSGDLTGTVTPQTLTMTGNKAVNAGFTLNGPYVLTLTTSGSGSGTIQASPAGPYYYGAVVTVWANASIGSHFTGFSGDLTGTTTPQTLVMNWNKAVNAGFTLNGPYSLTLTTSGTGSGTIEASPAGPYYYGAVVTIWANASIGSHFTGFSGNLTGTVTPQTLTMTGNKAVNAGFTLNGPYVLTLTTSGSGSGTIQASPAGPYYYGAVVTVWANASVGSRFSGFSGDLTGTTTPQTLTINGNKAVNADFTLNGSYALVIIINPVASGSVTTTPNGPYYYGTIVTLTATANPGYKFDHWSGDATGTNPITTVVMTGNKTVTAYFIQNQYTLTINITGKGTVIKDPEQITYTYNTVVKLTAVPATDWVFHSWGGDLTGSANPQSIIINGNKTISAHFTYDGNDTRPPVLKITKPLNNGMYIFNQFIAQFKSLKIPIIVQLLTIEANATDNKSGIDRVEFYINGMLKKTDNSAPYEYNWVTLICGKYNLSVKAYDNAGNVASSELTVFRWRIHPVLDYLIIFFGIVLKQH